jgi:hypothetical protein
MVLWSNEFSTTLEYFWMTINELKQYNNIVSWCQSALWKHFSSNSKYYFENDIFSCLVGDAWKNINLLIPSPSCNIQLKTAIFHYFTSSQTIYFYN